jgi:hypothetical protein
MASPDKIKIGAYLTTSENEALKRVADSLGVSASKAIALSIKSMDEKMSKGVKVSLPVNSQSIATDSDKIESLIETAIAPLVNRIDSLETELKKDGPLR